LEGTTAELKVKKQSWETGVEKKKFFEMSLLLFGYSLRN
jgi:hypothetical protein